MSGGHDDSDISNSERATPEPTFITKLIEDFGDISDSERATPKLTPINKLDEDFGDICDSERATPKPTPITKLLSTSFLSMYDELSHSSYTIWDYAQLHVNGVGNGRFRPTSTDDLLRYFEELFSPDINFQIRNNLFNLKESNLGGETALIQSKGTILGNILLDLKQLAHGFNDDSSEEDWRQVEQRKKKSKIGSSAGREGRESSDVPQGNSKEGGHGELHGGDDGGEDDDHEVTEAEAPGGKWFRDVERVDVELSLYDTPERSGMPDVKRERIRSIKDRARIFSRYERVSTSHVSYQPYNEGFVTLYHGTRLSTSEGFSREGILPYKNDTEFSPTPAFYVTNEVCAAFEFPLFNHLKAQPDDTVAVFCFEVGVGVLHGRTPTPSGHLFRVRWFEGSAFGKWRAFVTHNMYGKPPKRAHGFDVVIGPTCFPTGDTVFPRPGSLRQMAFVRRHRANG